MAINNFLGSWQLLADRSDYEIGAPPLEGTYTFESEDGRQLDITIDWIDARGQHQSVDYHAIPDGQKRPYEIPMAADEVMFEFTDENTLNSSAFREGRLTNFATRNIGEDGIMKVVQKGYVDGQEFVNVQYYEMLRDQ